MTPTLKIVLAILISISIASCKPNYNSLKNESTIHHKERIDYLIEQFNDSNGKDVMVIAHRSDWRNFPENSLEAMESAITIGVDMVEMDVAKTKDNQLIIMHDKTLDRTTTGKGLVSDNTLESIRTLYLKNGLSIPTKYRVPTLEEALLLCKGKVLINLDKSYEYFDEAFQVAKKTKTIKQIIIKGFNKTVDQVVLDFGSKLDSIIFMPVINLDTEPNALKIIDDFQDKLKVKAVEIVFSADTSKVLKRFSRIKIKGSRVWVNSLWSSLNAAHDDDTALKNTDSIYGWYVNQGVNMIQTDRPQFLIEYLKSKDLHK
ncbi:MAG: glycerophosphodiester phosphodiesterase family protein [Methylotenera sp.]|nr:glycerophosphodiester phosphodiesterase family protein [Flavobacterium sp.]